MSTSANTKANAAYDVVGQYDQNQINGFGEDLLNEMIGLLDPGQAATVLDAMAGDGNLSLRLFRYCQEHQLPMPDTTVLEYSRVQCEFARMHLSGYPARVVWGDVLNMTSLETGEPLGQQSFDRVMIKSSNHELPLSSQFQLYERVLSMLKPGGSFVNLGFLFDDPGERDEMRSIARVKDSLAGMQEAVVNRHFMSREELYERLQSAGFVDIHPARRFDYSIRSEIVTNHYFSRFGDKALEYDLEHQTAQLRAVKMRRSGRIRFERDCSIMLCPGEITVARRPLNEERLIRIYNKYPYDFLRQIEAHRQMLEETVRAIAPWGRVLDLGCGIGLLAERLTPRRVKYHGVDLSSAQIEVCRERYGALPNFEFETADINRAGFGVEEYESVTLLNVLYQHGVEPLNVLRKAHAALVPGGRLIVSGPTSADSFKRAMPQIRAQLERDGVLPAQAARFAEVCGANEQLLSKGGNYWSVEGMVALLQTLGFKKISTVDTGVYYGCSYLVVAEK